MTRASHVTPGQTVARMENLRRLAAELAVRSMRRDEIGDFLQMGPSGVRKYLADLADRVSTVQTADGQVFFLAMTPEHLQSYLNQLAAAPVVRERRPARTSLALAARDPARHIHVMQDDVHYSVRLHSAPVARDPLVAAFFGARGAEVRP